MINEDCKGSRILGLNSPVAKEPHFLSILSYAGCKPCQGKFPYFSVWRTHTRILHLRSALLTFFTYSLSHPPGYIDYRTAN